MTPEVLAALLRDLVPAAVAGLGGDVSAATGEVRVERPRQRAHGDYATNVALQTAKRAGVRPRDLAEAIAAELAKQPGITAASVAGAGFVNVSVAASAQAAVAVDILSAGENFGRAKKANPPNRINLEFVSANPTGPVHIGAVRWAAVGDALGRILEAAGVEVTREYYFNDAGSQIDRFARSLLAAARGEQPPEDGYAGGYVSEIASDVLAARPEAADLPDDQALSVFRNLGVELMFEEIRNSLHDFGVVFDVYFNEKTLHDEGGLDLALAELTRRGRVYEADGATWLRTTDFGDDKDRPLRKSDGDWTYFAADCAYYLDKRRRGFDRCVYMLGADHHGYVGRLRAMASCFDDDPTETLEVLIGQMVNLIKDGEPVRMSKRAGNVILLGDLVDAIGADAARYALARFSADSPIDLDLDLWASRTDDNPVFYVQYAHARLSSLLRNAAELGLYDASGTNASLGPGSRAMLVTHFRPELLEHPREGELLRALAGYPGVVATAAELREPHRVARYLEDLAGHFHRFYDVCRVLPMGDEAPSDVHRARLALVAATRVVVANGLGLLGVTAPERM